MLSARNRALILAAIALTLAMGGALYVRQNVTGGTGGVISAPKLAWLGYAVFAWFLLCPILATERAVSRPLRRALSGFSMLMWIRGLIELPMLFVWRNWRPPIGIFHDLACAVVLAVGLALRPGASAPKDPFNRWTRRFVAVQIASLIVEALYAGLFERAVSGATTGPRGLWFAAPGDPRFETINRLTSALDVAFYGFLIVYLVVILRMRAAPKATS
jgi:hypothetical protein